MQRSPDELELPGIGRLVRYKVAAKAERQARARARALVPGRKVTFADWRVLDAVFDLTTTFSKLVDRVRADEVARQAGVSPRQARRSLPKLAQDGHGIIVHIPGDGAGNLTLVGVPPEGVKADVYLSTFSEADLATFTRPEKPKGGQDRAEKVASQRARVKTEEREEEPQRLSEKVTVESEPSRDHDHVVGEGSTDDHRLLEKVQHAARSSKNGDPPWASFNPGQHKPREPESEQEPLVHVKPKAERARRPPWA